MGYFLPGSGRFELQRAHNNPMSTKTTIFLAIAAGFLGGIASQHISPPMVHAQAQPLIPKEIRAESFVIVDENGIPRGAFGIDKKGFPTVEATDAKGHVYLHGLDITIETPKGGDRSGKSKDGRLWSVTLPAHYGYIRRTQGADGDQVDVFIGPHVESELVFVIDQNRVPSGRWDEHKVILGTLSRREAKKLYHACYDPGWQGFADITTLTMEQFKDWLKGDTTKRAADTVRYSVPEDGSAFKFADLRNGVMRHLLESGVGLDEAFNQVDRVVANAKVAQEFRAP